MTADFGLHSLVHARFRKVFGPPRHTQAGGEQWSLAPSPGGTAIHVLLNGAATRPLVWIFDPYDFANGPWHTTVTAKVQIDDLIRQIHNRVQQAGTPRT